MKTPEEIDRLELLAASYACDYRDSPNKTNGIPDSYLVYSIAYDAFLDGYKAAMDQLADADNVINSPEKLDSWNSSNNSNGWISVKDRLPEEGVGWTMVYGCILSRWSVQPGFYDRQREEWISRFIGGDCDEEGYARLESVTHWLLIPEPPKEEK